MSARGKDARGMRRRRERVEASSIARARRPRVVVRGAPRGVRARRRRRERRARISAARRERVATTDAPPRRTRRARRARKRTTSDAWGALSSEDQDGCGANERGSKHVSIVALDEKAVSVPATQKFKTGTRYVILFVHSRSLVPRLQIGRNANCHFERDNACRSLLVREDANGVRPRAARAPVLPGAFDPARCVAARSRARAPPSAPRAPRARFSSVSPLALGVARARPTVAKKTHRSPRGNNNWPDGGWHRVCDRP